MACHRIAEACHRVPMATAKNAHASTCAPRGHLCEGQVRHLQEHEVGPAGHGIATEPTVKSILDLVA